jgi:diacylglycerol kinase (CTP)
VASLPSPNDALRPDEFASTLAPPDPVTLYRLTSDIDVDASIYIDDRDPQPSSPTTPRPASHSPAQTPTSQSRTDRHSFLENLAYVNARARASLTGLIRSSPLPSFPHCWQQAMASSRQYQVPQTPRVISPSPTPSEIGAKDGYFGPTTRSAARKSRAAPSHPQIDDESSSSDPEKRARARSRSPILEVGGRRRRMSALTSMKKLNGKKGELALPNGTVNGHLSPQAANKNYWREMSRSPSPLGLIPIHQKWRSFVRSPLHCAIPQG